MKKTFALAVTLAMVFAFATNVPAEEEMLDCDELVELSEALDTISAAVDDAEAEDLNEIDSDLGDVIKALRVVAKSEGNSSLTGALNRLEAAYKAKNQAAFVKAIDGVTEAIDAIEDEDC
ncbi:MAG: hypothetical protein KDK39_11320 [Leptospiraceae bacterium]|nr:hypothetical protein [Leptospiraceae bacterium]